MGRWAGRMGRLAQLARGFSPSLYLFGLFFFLFLFFLFCFNSF